MTESAGADPANGAALVPTRAARHLHAPTSSRLDRVTRMLATEVDASGMAAFRVLFGVVVAISAGRFLAYGWVDAFFVRPRFFFRYWFAPWVEPLPPTWMHLLFWVLGASGIAVAAGFFYRWAVAILFVAFTYLQLVDVTNYINHYYLVSVLALLGCFLPLGDAYSFDAWRVARRTGGSLRTTLPRLGSVAVRTQIATVYFFAGVAKLETDWLVHAQPLDLWLSARIDRPVLGPLFAQPWAPHAFAWAGCLFDLTIAGWLTWKRSRPFAFAAVVVFHALTKAMLPVIGMFPVIMTIGATSFLPHDWPKRLRDRAMRVLDTTRPSLTSRAHAVSEPKTVLSDVPSRRTKLAIVAWAAFALVQVALPMRAFAYGGDVLWHEQGMRFSWRVVVREKMGDVRYLVVDPESGRRTTVRPVDYLDERQTREFATQPDLVLQLAHRIADDYSSRWGHRVRVYAETYVSLNGRAAAPLIDRSVDLASVSDGLAPAHWIAPSPTSKPPFLHRVR